MAIDYSRPAIPKGDSLQTIRQRKRRADAKGLKAFRDACWLREERKLFVTGGLEPKCYIARHGDCQHCGAPVHRLPDAPMTGEVHHRRSRRHKETRYDPDNGVLLCNHLVNNCHERAQRGEIAV